MHHSKIPSISVVTTPKSNGYPPLKRQRLSSSMLQDVTNQVHSTVPRRSSTEEPTSQRKRLMNKYVFGDASIIEEVKKRERKIMKDITHFRNAIAEIEKETAQIRERQLPDTQYEISKRLTSSNEIKRENSQLASQLDLKDREIDLFRRNEELEMSNLQLQYSVDTQELENQLKQKLDDERLKWDKQVLELENLKPDEEVAQEIRQLKAELNEVNKQWDTLQQENRRRCEEYREELMKQFEDFKRSKQEPMDSLIKEQQHFIKKRKQLIDRRNNLKNQITSNKEEYLSLQEKIKDVEKTIKDVKDRSIPLKDQLAVTIKHYEEAKQETEATQEVAHRKELFYKSKFDKMEQEQWRRRKLENTIDELKGDIRVFAYVTNDEKSSNLQVNYAERSLNDRRIKEKFYFNRIIPSALETEGELLFQEYEMYHEMCLQNRTNFSLISVSQRPWDVLRMALLNFVFAKCHHEYQIKVQYVFLSEESPSQDLLLPSTEEVDNEIKLKIQKESIELDSKTTEMKTGIVDLPLGIKKESNNRQPGIGILKFQLTRLKIQTGKSKEDPVNFYFIEINESSTISILDKVVCPGNAIKTPISIILRKLLSDTTSCFLFDIDDVRDNRNILDVSRKLAQMKSIKTRRISE